MHFFDIPANSRWGNLAERTFRASILRLWWKFLGSTWTNWFYRESHTNVHGPKGSLSISDEGSKIEHLIMFIWSTVHFKFSSSANSMSIENWSRQKVIWWEFVWSFSKDDITSLLRILRRSGFMSICHHYVRRVLAGFTFACIWAESLCSWYFLL